MLPTSNAQKYLQAHYTAPHTDWDDAIKVDDAGDGSPWSSANARFNDFFRQIVNRFKFEDALPLDTRGNVVYSAYKAADLGTNILAGPFSGGDLTQAYRKALETNVVDYVGVTDFSNYQPSAAPTAWLVSPWAPPVASTGYWRCSSPRPGLNRIMTDGRKLGGCRDGDDRGDLPGRSGWLDALRTLDCSRRTRRVREARDRSACAARCGQAVGDLGGNILVQPVTDDATRRALQGQTGTVVEDDYLAREALQAYAPVDLPGLDWRDHRQHRQRGAFAPVASFTRNLVLSTAGIIFVVSIAAMLLARAVHPAYPPAGGRGRADQLRGLRGHRPGPVQD